MTRFRLESPLGPAHSVDASDVKAVNRALSALRLTKTPADTSGFPNREMFEGILRFQRRNGLREDGEMEPAGPTARAEPPEGHGHCASGIGRHGLPR